MLISPPADVVQQPNYALRDSRWWFWAGYAVLALGLLLRAVVWAQQRSIVLDEANLIRNYVERSYGQLFQPLDYERTRHPCFRWR